MSTAEQHKIELSNNCISILVFDFDLPPDTRRISQSLDRNDLNDFAGEMNVPFQIKVESIALKPFENTLVRQKRRHVVWDRKVRESHHLLGRVDDSGAIDGRVTLAFSEAPESSQSRLLLKALRV